nr:ornithine decarboxylase [Nocardia arthritidis]
MAPGDVLFSNPVRPRSHIAEAHRRGVWRFCTDSRSELVKLSAAAPGAAVYVRLATRSAASLVPSEGKFGVDPSVAADLLERAHSLGLSPYGISFHVGSQMTDPHAWDQPISDAIHIAKQLADKGIRLEMLDIGGGFPARYGSDVPSLTEFGTHIACLLENLPYPMSVVAEPGRSLVAEAGVLVCKVIQVVRRAETWWVHTDLGVFNGMMEVLESNGQLRYPITSSSSGHMRTYHVTGPTCDSQDTFAFDVNLPASLSEGDLLFIHSAGAYTTAYSTRFNGFDEPTTVHHYSR